MLQAKFEHDPLPFTAPPKMRASTVIFDIDDTITYATTKGAQNAAMTALVHLAQRSLHLPEPEARNYIREILDPDKPLDDTLLLLGISEEEFGDEVTKCLSRCVKGYSDAIDCIRVLAASGFRLLTGTTNSQLICHAKLRVAGLLGPCSIAPFASLRGGAEVHPQGKSGPEFFVHLLRMHGLKPDEVVHVGDLPYIDLGYAREAGISQVVLPRRDQEEDWVMEPDGGLYLRSLNVLPEYLEKL